MSKHRLYAERYANGLLIGKHGHTEMVLTPEDEDTLRAALRSDSPVSPEMDAELEAALEHQNVIQNMPVDEWAESMSQSMIDADDAGMGNFGLDRPASTGGERDEYADENGLRWDDPRITAPGVLTPEQVTEAQDMADEVINAVIREWREMKQDREHDMDLAYANGWCDREAALRSDSPVSGIEVEVSGPVDGRGKRYIVTLAESPDEALRGSYVLLPRPQVEGDPTTEQERDDGRD